MLRILTEVASSPTEGSRPVFRFVHFNIAHAPFIGACQSVRCDPFDLNDQSYGAQLTRS